MNVAGRQTRRTVYAICRTSVERVSVELEPDLSPEPKPELDPDLSPELNLGAQSPAKTRATVALPTPLEPVITRCMHDLRVRVRPWFGPWFQVLAGPNRNEVRGPLSPEPFGHRFGPSRTVPNPEPMLPCDIGEAYNCSTSTSALMVTLTFAILKNFTGFDSCPEARISPPRPLDKVSSNAGFGDGWLSNFAISVSGVGITPQDSV
ncbi:uncharacterized protein EDB91DRAFT_1336744 [Suillus paluster]|uniref:uncharacterized protein n=1 Tax=Suillus paluster TaxID=48578 RepID=UPI001B8611B0|nr:uncharacterized protein EDB91DRAFT_1336744 [Suillus paluster]KAG1739378.1 hypothetical protein EDB91DRAFT_1336744 [Suillus paluster]